LCIALDLRLQLVQVLGADSPDRADYCGALRVRNRFDSQSHGPVWGPRPVDVQSLNHCYLFDSQVLMISRRAAFFSGCLKFGLERRP